MKPDRPRRSHYYPQASREIKAAQINGDPQAPVVYVWQTALLAHTPPGLHPAVKRYQRPIVEGDHSHAELRAEALKFLQYLWSKHAPQFRPYWSGVPYLRLQSLNRFLREPLKEEIGYARVVSHSIHLTRRGLWREVLLHETAHLLEWRDLHGPLFCKVLLHLWVEEFGIDRAHALAEAERLGVSVAL